MEAIVSNAHDLIEELTEGNRGLNTIKVIRNELEAVCIQWKLGMVKYGNKVLFSIPR